MARPCTRSRPVGVEHATELLGEVTPRADPLEALRRFMPRRKVAPLPDMPRFTGGAVGMLAYDAVSSFERTVPLPDKDPVGTPLAAFMETDLRPRLRPSDAHACQRSPRCIRTPPTSTPGTASPSARCSTCWSEPQRGVDCCSTHVAAADRASQTKPASIALSTSPRSKQPSERSSSGEIIQAVLARRQSFDAGRNRRASTSIARSVASARAHICSSSACLISRSSAPARNSSSGSNRTTLSTHPIAGTRPRGATAAADDELAKTCSPTARSAAEHVMLVDLARNDLGRVARPGSVTVTRYMQVERFSHVQHLVSHVEAELARRLRPSTHCAACSRPER